MSPPDHWTLRARGHPAIRSTHARSIELTAENEIGPGATCVVGVSADISEEIALTRGALRLRFAAGGHTTTLSAWRSPSWASASRIVVRTTTFTDGDTFAVGATAGAAQLDRDLLGALRSSAPLTVEITPIGSPPPLVVAAPPGFPLADLPAGLRRHLAVAARTGRLSAFVPPRGHRDAAPWPELKGQVTTSLADIDNGTVVTAQDSERLLLGALDTLDDGPRRRLRLALVEPSHLADALLLLLGHPATPAVSLGVVPTRPARRRRLLGEALRAGLPLAFAVADGLSRELAEDVEQLSPGATVIWAAPEPDFGLALAGSAPAGLDAPPGLRRGVVLSGSSPRRPDG